MKITKESTGDLTMQVRIEISPEDYSAAVEKQINDYRRKANIPGFRPGHIPAGLIRKMYGKAILAEEVNRLLSDSLMNYIRDEKLDILGNPLANTEKSGPVDFDNQESFDFWFDLGLTPEFTLPLNEDLGIVRYSITISDEMVDRYIDDTRKRYGKPVEPAEGADPETAGEAEQKAKSEERIPAEMTPEFFDMVYPGMDLQTEEDFREQVRRDATQSFAGESDKLLFDDITRALVEKTVMAMPDEFLKRWLADNNEGKYSPEEIEKNYPSFAESMKWQLIENRLIRDNGLAVTEEDIRNYIRVYMLRQLNMTDADPEMQQRYESIVDSLMQNKEQVQRINDQLYNARMMEFFLSNMQFTAQEVTYEDFIKMAAERHAHDHHGHDHDHHHHHDHPDHHHDHPDHHHDHPDPHHDHPDHPAHHHDHPDHHHDHPDQPEK